MRIMVNDIQLLGGVSAPFQKDFAWDVRFTCRELLNDELNWKVVYVGSCESDRYDQLLEDAMVGPVALGLNEFVLEADAPDASLLPNDQILGVTAVIIIASYKEQEFIRVGYYVNNEEPAVEEDQQQQREAEGAEPKRVDPSKVIRTILANKPRVTTTTINWEK